MSGIISGAGSKSGVIGPEFGRQKSPWAFYWLNSALYPAASTEVIIHFDGGPTETNNWVNQSSGVFTVNVPGVWVWHCRIRWNDAMGEQQLQMKFNDSGGTQGGNYDYNHSASKWESLQVSGVHRMNTTDNVRFGAYQNSGSTRTLDGNSSRAHIMWCHMIG